MIEVVRWFLSPKYIHVPLGSGATKGKNENLKVSNMYVCGRSIYVLKGSSENGQMRVCLTGKIGGIFCISLLCQREKELSAVRIGASSYILKKRLGLSQVEKTSSRI